MTAPGGPVGADRPDPDALALAERAREMHYAVATSENRSISSGDSPVYRASRALFVTAIRTAYPHLDPLAVYGVWLDCNESVAHCARWAADPDTCERYATGLSDIESAMVMLAAL